MNKLETSMKDQSAEADRKVIATLNELIETSKDGETVPAASALV